LVSVQVENCLAGWASAWRSSCTIQLNVTVFLSRRQQEVVERKSRPSCHLH
jgi:hypothetical protein